MKTSVLSRLVCSARALVILGSASAVFVGATGGALANDNCGGLNQRVCKKWEQLRGCDPGLHRTSPIGGTCTRDNKLIPDAIERRVVGFYEPRETDCGGDGQRVCRKNEQLRGCDPGLHRTSPINGMCTPDNKLVPDVIENAKLYEPRHTHCGGNGQRVCRKNEQLRGCDPGLHRTSPINGMCTPDNKLVPDFLETGDLKEKAKEIADAMTAHQRVLRDIGGCIATGGGSAFRQAVDRKDANGAARIVFGCVTPEQLRILATPPVLGGAHAVGFKSVSVGIGASSMFGAGLGGEAGVVLALDATAPPRLYTAGGMKFGLGAGVSGDVIVGISTDRVTPGKSDGIGIGAGGKAIGGAGVGVFFSNIHDHDRPFNAFSVSAGAGASFEIGTVNPTWSRIY